MSTDPVRISPPHVSTPNPYEHVNVGFPQPKGPGQRVLPFPDIHLPAPCQPDFNPIPGWEPGR